MTDERAADFVEAALIEHEHFDVVPRVGYNGPWASGPWDNEPDVVEYRRGQFSFLVLRHRSIGHLCGYIGVMPDHPWHGKSYGDDDLINLDTHGGLTYSSAGPWDLDMIVVDLPGMWWLGFDCAHSGDETPAHPRAGQADYYKTIRYVREELDKLQAQAEAAAK